MPTDEESSLLHDHSTFWGKVRMLNNRLSWSWILSAILFVSLLSWAILADTSNLDSPPLPSAAPPPSSASPSSSSSSPLPLKRSTPILTSRFNENNPRSPSSKFSKGLYKVVGAENQMTPFQGFKSLPDKMSLTALHLENLLIDAATLSADLQGCHALRELTMDKVSVTGEFSRVFLPNLTDFMYNQHRNGHIDSYKEPPTLKSLIFFNMLADSEWDFSELLRLPPNISVAVGGTTILEINRKAGFLNLNVHYCDQVLRSTADLGQPGMEILSHFTQLTLSWCGGVTAEILPPTLRYLSMNNAVPDTVDLVKVLEKSKDLVEFHAFRPSLCEDFSCVNALDASNPDGPIQLDFASFPPSIRTVSLSKLQVGTQSTVPFVSPIVNLTLEGCNVTGLDLEAFHLTFANVERFALFKSVEVRDAYRMLGAIVKTDVEWILMEKFKRDVTGGEVELENFLSEIGVPATSENFLIERIREREPGEGAESARWRRYFKGRELTDFEKNYHRFNLFKFSDIDSYDDYLIWDSKF